LNSELSKELDHSVKEQSRLQQHCNQLVAQKEILETELTTTKEELTAFKITHEQKISKSEELRSELIDQLAKKDVQITSLQQHLYSSNSELRILETQISSMNIPMEEIPLDTQKSQETLDYELKSYGISRTPSMNSGTSY
jgi:chromosome segregation ATPase